MYRETLYLVCNSVNLKLSTHIFKCSFSPHFSLSKRAPTVLRRVRVIPGSLWSERRMEKPAQITHALLPKLPDTSYSPQEPTQPEGKVSGSTKSEWLIFFSCPEGRRKEALRNQKREKLNAPYFSLKNNNSIAKGIFFEQ